MLAIKGGTFLTPDRQIKDGVLLIDNGKIVDIGETTAIPAGAEVIDASDRMIMPGMIDAHCHTGVFADGVGWHHSDGNEATLTEEHLTVESGWFSHGHEVETLTVNDTVVVITKA